MAVEAGPAPASRTLEGSHPGAFRASAATGVRSLKGPRGGVLQLVTKAVEERERVVVRFAGDSGDGMQLVGGRFTDATAVLGNDLATLPDFPAEIRAPAGTLPGVSAFQIHFASRDILTPGDAPNVLVAMNPAALKANLGALERGATIIVNEDAFTKRNLEKAGYAANPLEDGALDRLPRPPRPDDDAHHARRRGHRGRHHARRRAREEPLRARRCCRGCTAGRPRSPSTGSRRSSPTGRRSREANLAAFRAGWNFGETTELLDVQYRVDAGDRRRARAPTATSTARRRLALGLIAASVRSGLPLLLASYPITPASELLHELSRHEQLRRAHDPGRGRDRRRRDGARRRVRRPARRDRDERPGDGPEGRDDRPRGRRSSCRWSIVDVQRAGPVDRACRRRPSSPTC